ncbi:MAG: aminopeptidase [Clostridiales bacterium]|nr:aminopeptidase [Clostridiales bacterium]
MFNKFDYEKKLANKLITYSCKVQKGEKVLITYSDCPDSIIEHLIEEITLCGGIPLPFRLDKTIKRRLLLNSTTEWFEYYRQIVEPIMSSADAVILIGGSHNDFELSDISANTFAEYSKLYVEPIHFKIRCSKKWVLLRYPTPSFAQSSGISSESFEEFFYKVCTLDYESLDKKMNNLKELMEKTDKVHIVTPTTDLTFSIKDMPAIKCSGQCNIPDGEIYTAPVKNSVNGTIVFNVPAIDNGSEFNNISLTFENGKIIDFNCNNNEAFEEILNTDSGSRYLGEFAFGLNPYCTEPKKDILFDEKMISSIHLAIGSSYEDCFNGNISAVHLDLIQSHKENLGGGKIYFDGALIYENGKFIYPNLVDLNQ